MRLAGTASQYSKKAMPQLTSTAAQIGVALYFRCPYQANVMNTFEATSRTIGETVGGMGKPVGARGRRSSRLRRGPRASPPPKPLRGLRVVPSDRTRGNGYGHRPGQGLRH